MKVEAKETAQWTFLYETFCGRLLGGCWSRSCKICSGSSKSFMMILWDFLRGLGMKILLKVFYMSLWEDLVEILFTFSSRGPCMKFLCSGACMIFLDAQMKILYEDRRSCCCSCENVSPHLLLFHRYCCLYPVQSLPTFHVVWGLLPVIFLFWEAVFYCVLHVWFWGEEQGYATSTVTGGETFIIGGFKHVFLVHIQRLLLTKGWNPQSVFVIFVNRMVRV